MNRISVNHFAIHHGALLDSTFYTSQFKVKGLLFINNEKIQLEQLSSHQIKQWHAFTCITFRWQPSSSHYQNTHHTRLLRMLHACVVNYSIFVDEKMKIVDTN